MKNTILIASCILVIFGCKDASLKNQDFESKNVPTKSDRIDTSSRNIKFYIKPDDCTAFLKSLDFSTFCLTLDNLSLNEHITTQKACNIDISTRNITRNNSNLDVNFYYENDPNEMEHFQLITEIQKKAVPNSTHKMVDGLGDSAFIVNQSMIEKKLLVMTISNVRVMIHSEMEKGKENCMFEDQQLINLAKAIANKIN